jgi:hypothetical protein
MTRAGFKWLAVCLTSLAFARAHADTPRFEITPFIGYRMGGNFDASSTSGSTESADLDPAMSYGIDLGLYRDGYSFYEFLYGRQEASVDSDDPALANLDVDVEYFQVGGTAFFESDVQHAMPFVSLTIGATHLSPRQGNYDDETKFSGSIGGGVRVPFNDRIAATLGLRGYLTFVDSDSDIFCVSGPNGASCLLRSSGSTFFQGEAQLGLTVRF